MYARLLVNKDFFMLLVVPADGIPPNHIGVENRRYNEKKRV
jgi:hypothetical protein